MAALVGAARGEPMSRSRRCSNANPCRPVHSGRGMSAPRWMGLLAIGTAFAAVGLPGRICAAKSISQVEHEASSPSPTTHPTRPPSEGGSAIAGSVNAYGVAHASHLKEGSRWDPFVHTFISERIELTLDESARADLQLDAIAGPCGRAFLARAAVGHSVLAQGRLFEDARGYLATHEQAIYMGELRAGAYRVSGLVRNTVAISASPDLQPSFAGTEAQLGVAVEGYVPGTAQTGVRISLAAGPGMVVDSAGKPQVDPTMNALVELGVW